MSLDSSDRLPLLQGTLDLLILRTLRLGPVHGHGIVKCIQRNSESILQVEHGSLYPALHRLERKGWIVSKWEDSAAGRSMKLYRLTDEGRKHLLVETSRWEQLARAIGLVLQGT